ncbi:MAG: MarR family transcriptional regulator [Caldilineaceae bacterium]|nr:MarR family transcriptional regulator [Caldilineaceae bacterium]
MSRADMTEAFMQEIRHMSTWTVMFHQAASLALGLNPTDGKCLSVLREMGPLTAGELAQLIGLTTGAVTGVIDRLEKRGFVQRVADPHDRRRVIVEPIAGAINTPEMGAIYGPLAAATKSEFIDQYSDEELAVVLNFIQRGAALMQAQTMRLQQENREG